MGPSPVDAQKSLACAVCMARAEVCTVGKVLTEGTGENNAIDEAEGRESCRKMALGPLPPRSVVKLSRGQKRM